MHYMNKDPSKERLNTEDYKE